jgi:soluble lytic murein transglycosylase-like protein
MIRRALIVGAVLLTLCATAQAAANACFAHAAARRHLDVNLLYAIARVESRFHPDVTNKKTGAIGEMQIMPWHLKWLAKYQISGQDLYDECTNINVGAFILSDFIRMYGKTWRAVGAYGAGIAPDKEAARTGYAQSVQSAYARIVRDPASRTATYGTAHSASRDAAGRPTMVAD